jgi:hypothetical protein
VQYGLFDGFVFGVFCKSLAKGIGRVVVFLSNGVVFYAGNDIFFDCAFALDGKRLLFALISFTLGL